MYYKNKTYKKKYKRNGGALDVNVNALTYNMSWASQQNIEAGSEEDFVRLCKTLGRNCYNEALTLIGTLHKEYKFDVIGIQEVEDPELIPKIISLTNLDGFYRGATWKSQSPFPNIYSGCAILWNTNKLGKMKSCKTINLATPNEDNTCDARTCCIVTTTNNVHLIVAHFPWITTQEDINKVSDLLNTHISPSGAVIILTDANDGNTVISSENPLIIHGRKLSHGLTRRDAKRNLKSCCWHEKDHKLKWQHFDSTGDYILSEKVNSIKIPITHPSNNPDEVNLYSDHMPVIANLTINIMPITGIAALAMYENNKSKTIKSKTI